MFTAQDHQGRSYTVTRANVAYLKTQQSAYFCQACQEELVIKAGPLKTPHFAHKRSSKCSFASEGESERHLSGKWLLADWFLRQGHEISLEHYLKTIARQADILIDQKIAIEFQCATIPISQLIDRTHDYMQAGLRVEWILGQPLEMCKGRYHLTAFQKAFIRKSDEWGYYLWSFSVSEQCLRLYYHLTYEGGNRFFASVMDLPLDWCETDMKKAVGRIRFRQFYLKQNLQLERQKTCYYYAKYKARGNFMRTLYASGLTLHSLPKEIGVQLNSQFLVITPAIEWQYQLYSHFFEQLSAGNIFTKRQVGACFQKIVQPIKTIYLSERACWSLLEEYLLYLEKQQVLVQIDDEQYLFKRLIQRANWHASK
ncbi:competence protein CoiA family protein [Listeria costaricensis]|uniref:competence protein CoiA family protein n=1 Tax=Listeria costaricensis TaxID=2026604 RepID=UPI000C08C5E1|nr:competence protein CoiA family protein [Listeria costaricensis]